MDNLTWEEEKKVQLWRYERGAYDNLAHRMRRRSEVLVGGESSGPLEQVIGYLRWKLNSWRALRGG